MAKIYFRRQATIPPTGTNGIAVFCTTNETLYLDGIPYGGGSSRGAITNLTKETWWGGKSEIVIEDGSANIDLTDVARQYDVQRLLEDVAVIKSELELDGPLNPSGDPRSAIDILNEDLTKVNKDLQRTKQQVVNNKDNIAKNSSGITVLNNQYLQLSAATLQNAKDIAINAGKINNCESEHQLLKNEVLHHHEEIDVLQATYVSGVALNNKRGEFRNNVVYLEFSAKTYDEEINALSGAIDTVSDNLDSLSGEVIDFEEQVATDIETISGYIDSVSGQIINVKNALSGAIDNVSGSVDAVSAVVDTKLSGVSVNGKNVPVSGMVAQLNDITVEIIGKDLYVTNLTGGTVSASLPADNYISAGTYNADKEELEFTMTDGRSITVNVSGLVDTYTADGNSIVLNDKKFSVSTAITNTIDNNVDNIASISGTYLSGITVNGVKGTVSANVAEVNIPVVNVKSSDSSVTVSTITSGANVTYDLSILNKEIIDYLFDLLTYKYGYTASTTNITIDITKALSGSATATLTSGKYRGLDYPTYSKDKQQSVSVTGSSSESTGWSKKSATQWTYTHTITDKTVHTVSGAKFKATVENADGKTGTTNEVTASITINKPWIIIEGKTTPTDIDAYLNSPTTANKNGVGNFTQTTETTFPVNTAGDYFYICAPSNKTITYTQNNASQIEDAGTIETVYGTYKISKSKATQAKATIKGVLTIK